MLEVYKDAIIADVAIGEKDSIDVTPFYDMDGFYVTRQEEIHQDR